MFPLGIALLGCGILYLCWPVIIETFPLGVRLLHDHYDVSVYYKSSRWAVGDGSLYLDVFSEYPPLANILYGFCRALSHRFLLSGDERQTFGLIWACAGWLSFVAASYLVLSRLKPSRYALLAWFAPSTLYFSLYRFDIYPALATMLCLLAARDERLRLASLWLGLSIGLKGYALFALPSFAVYVWQRRGVRAAAECTLLCLAPFLLGNLVIFCYAGADGVAQPFLFHAKRWLNGQSTYDGLFLGGMLPPRLPFLLQALCALAPAFRRPATFQALVQCMLFSILGFVNFAVFYSPQFCLWIVAIAVFSENRRVLLLTAFLTWLSFIYFPWAFDRREAPDMGPQIYSAVITTLSLLRLWLMATAWKQIAHSRSLKASPSA